MRHRSGFNPKRRLAKLADLSFDDLERLAMLAKYTGNPEHKLRPNNYGLLPPASPRPGKTLCDGTGDISKEQALDLLRDGFRRGIVSDRRRNGWPKNVWAVRGNVAFEAQLENEDQGSYHGYPMAKEDAFLTVVVREWGARER